MTEFTYSSSVNGQQQQWFQEAISRLDHTFPASQLPLKITVKTVPEPPCVGHNDYMCTQTLSTDGVVTDIQIFIREGAETQAVARQATTDLAHAFFMEAVVHEFGHVLTFTYLALDDAAREEMAGWFIWRGEGGTTRHGELDDWNPTDKKWESRIQEAVAEWFKDLYMPRKYRAYDNRTDWWFDQDYLSDWFSKIERVICPQPPVIS